MKRKLFAILCIFIMLMSYSVIAGTAIYNVPIQDGRPVPEVTDEDGNEYVDGGTDTFITKYKAIAVFAGGLGTISMVAAMLYNVARLNVSMGNPMQRQQCLRGILVCGVFAALLGSATFFVGLFYGALR